jgi:hypothetical protein
MDVRKIIYELHELFDLLVILKHFPIFYVIKDGRNIPHLNIISHFWNNKGFKGTSAGEQNGDRSACLVGFTKAEHLWQQGC